MIPGEINSRRPGPGLFLPTQGLRPCLNPRGGDLFVGLVVLELRDHHVSVRDLGVTTL